MPNSQLTSLRYWWPKGWSASFYLYNLLLIPSHRLVPMVVGLTAFLKRLAQRWGIDDETINGLRADLAGPLLVLWLHYRCTLSSNSFNCIWPVLGPLFMLWSGTHMYYMACYEIGGHSLPFWLLRHLLVLSPRLSVAPLLWLVLWSLVLLLHGLTSQLLWILLESWHSDQRRTKNEPRLAVPSCHGRRWS